MSTVNETHRPCPLHPIRSGSAGRHCGPLDKPHQVALQPAAQELQLPGEEQLPVATWLLLPAAAHRACAGAAVLGSLGRFRGQQGLRPVPAGPLCLGAPPHADPGPARPQIPHQVSPAPLKRLGPWLQKVKGDQLLCHL